MTRALNYTLVVSISLLSLGCAATIPREALMLQQDSLARRQLARRSFDTQDELRLLQTSTMALQDLSFNLDESETQLGVL